MNKGYDIIIERSISIPYSIDREDALKLIKEEWDEEIAEQCKNDNKMLDKYMKKYAQRVSGGAHISEYFSEGDGEYTDYKPSWLQIHNENHDVLWETDALDYLSEDEDGEQ